MKEYTFWMSLLLLMLAGCSSDDDIIGYDAVYQIKYYSQPPYANSEQGTEYMVLGSEGQFRLVTSDAINDGSTNVRRPVNSFEQYWKTWNTNPRKTPLTIIS